MKHPNENGNGTVPHSSGAGTHGSATKGRPTADYGALRNTLIAGHEMETRLRSLETMLEQSHPDMAMLLKNHGPEIRSVMTAALDDGIQAERRRLTWLLHNDLARLLSDARRGMSAVVNACDDESICDALRGIDLCLCVAAKVTRGLISDLGPSALCTKME